jgi:GNAT superfamily N-acetyltransferase
VIEVRLVRYDDAVARGLVVAALADLAERYGGGSGDDTPVEAAHFVPPDGAFLVAFLGGEPVGCAGWRSHGDDGETAELKRMYAAPAARGKGVGRRLLRAVEESARAHGRKRMIMELGSEQPEAEALYRSNGYEPIEHFGYYRDYPDVISLGRRLTLG